MEWVLAMTLGTLLSISTGFRTFLPPLIVSFLAWLGIVPLPDGMAWLGSTPALITLIIAAVAEIVAHYIPAVATFLKWAQTPLVVLTGTLMMLIPLSDSSMGPLVDWIMAIAVGGGSATVTHAALASIRTAFASVTAGISDIVVTTVETLAGMLIATFSVLLFALTVILPVFLVIILGIGLLIAMAMGIWIISRSLVSAPQG